MARQKTQKWETTESSCDYDYLFNIFLVGDRSTGKRSLIQQFTEGIFTEDSYYPHYGFEEYWKIVKLHGKIIKLKIWSDTGLFKDSIVHDYPDPYFQAKEADGILLICDLSDSEFLTNLRYMLQEMDFYMYERNYIQCRLIVLNKCDIKCEEVDFTHVKEFADLYEVPFLKTSAKTGNNVEEVFMTLVANILEQKRQNELNEPKEEKEVTIEHTRGRKFFSGVWNALRRKNQPFDNSRSKDDVMESKLAASTEESSEDAKHKSTGAVLPTTSQKRDLEAQQLQLQLSKKEEENEELQFQINILEEKRQALENNVKAMENIIQKTELTVEQQKELIQEKQKETSELQNQLSIHQRKIYSLEQDLLAKESTIQRNEVTIAEQQEEIHQYRTNPHWVIEKEEIVMTADVLGKGGWGEVKVGIFRGTKVAVKCLHQAILSEYYLELFSREMDIASRVRHPNLLQFVGATRQGNPMVVTELMPTSLRNELEKSRMTKSQVIGIGIHVASALNYLHLWKPQPILHRDVSSGNVLLEPAGGDQWKAKLSDYGSANLLDKIRNTTAPGSPAYSAPEAQTPSVHSPAMDMYSFGVLLMEMATGRFPSTILFEREAQIKSIKWTDLKTLIECLTNRNLSSRPTAQHVIKDLNAKL